MQRSPSPRAVISASTCEERLFGNFEKDDWLCAGGGEDAHHLRADESAGAGNEDASAGKARNEDRVGACRRRDREFPPSKPGTCDATRRRNQSALCEIIIATIPPMPVTLLPATEQLAMLRRGAIAPLELAEEHIAQIQRLNPKLNALVDFDAERVRAQAAQARPGPLSGLPVTVKSSISVKGYRCEIGSTLNRGSIPEKNAVLVDRLIEAGAVILGTTNCPEFLMAYETENLLYGSTRNPWNPDYTAGGSSGGEAAAIAAGMSAGGLGSDSGGSVREPAHFTGICALKPTAGQFPAAGHLPPCRDHFHSWDRSGRWPGRSATWLCFLRRWPGRTSTDPNSAPAAHRTVSLEDAKRVPIGWFEDDGLVPVTAETRVAVQQAAQALERQGFTLKPFRPEALEAARKLWWIFFVQCGAMLYAPTIRGHERRAELDLSRFSRHGPCRDAADGRFAARCMGRVRQDARTTAGADAGVSNFIVPGVLDSGVSALRAQLERRGRGVSRISTPCDIRSGSTCWADRPPSCR